jgi:hypothetical protein
VEKTRPYLKIRNWDDYQHYKNRNPPWIKLHYEILNSYDWVMLADASRTLMIVCMLIASRHEGRIPYDPEYIKRVGSLKSRPNLKPLIDIGFLVGDSTTLADASTLQADDCSETETERETEKRQSKTPLTPQNGFDDFWKVYPRKVKKQDAVKAWNAIGMKNGMRERIIQSVEDHVHCHDWKKDNGEYIPYPASFLNGKRWEDELPARPETMEETYERMKAEGRAT